MNDGFTRKKVESLTLGEKLKKLRGDFRMSLTEISKATRIQVKYLEYLENGEYDKLPADVYVRGFLKSYASYLNIDEQAFIKLYERERHIQKNLNQKSETKSVRIKNLNISSLVITPRSLVIVMITLLVIGAFSYIFREFQTFALVPRLVILSPITGSRVEKNEVIVQGKTDKGARVSINNQSVFVDGEGNFSSTIPLQSGLNTMTIIAVDRFEKQKTEILSIDSSYVSPISDTRGESNTLDAQVFRVAISVHEKPIRITVKENDIVIFDGILNKGETKLVESKETIKIISEDATKTFVQWNDDEEEPLSLDKKPKTALVFTLAGKQL